MMRPVLVLSLVAAIALAGCRPSASEQSRKPAAEAEVPAVAVTVWTPKTELFAEHRAFVVGQPSKFAAHVTDLRDWSAVREGRMEAIFTGPDGKETVFPADAPARPGIFQPIATPSVTGTHRLRFRVVAPGLTDTIDAGDAVVYADVAAARAAIGEEAEAAGDAIGFLKEQQWKLPFMTAPVATNEVESGVTLQGEVKPAGGHEAAIAAPAAGRLVIRGRPPRLGDRVTRGQVLAVLTPDESAGEDRATLRAAAREAEATSRQAEADLARAQRLVAAQAAPGRRLEEARTTAAVARARLAAARDRLRAKGATLAGAAAVTEESYSLTAPIAGTLVEARAVPGAHVAAGSSLFRVVDLRRVWVEGRVAEADANRVAGARAASITAPGATARGQLVAVGAVLDPATRTAPALFEAANPAGALRIGMTARITAITGTVRGAVIPRSAIVDDNGTPIAYVQTGGESFERRALVLGPQAGDRVLVEAGLEAGERVVTRGGYEIRLATLSDAVPAHGHEH